MCVGMPVSVSCTLKCMYEAVPSSKHAALTGIPANRIQPHGHLVKLVWGCAQGAHYTADVGPLMYPCKSCCVCASKSAKNIVITLHVRSLLKPWHRQHLLRMFFLLDFLKTVYAHDPHGLCPPVSQAGTKSCTGAKC
jgi:hypothetical protein